jgi:hypothetical protein
MWTHHFEQKTNLPVEKLWTVIADVAGWVNIDHNIDKLEISEIPKQGTKFNLKPKGGPTLKFIIDTFNPPSEYADLCAMPGAKMKTLHTFEKINDNETLIKVDIEIYGTISWLWGRLVGKKHASGLPKQTELFIEAAKKA